MAMSTIQYVRHAQSGVRFSGTRATALRMAFAKISSELIDDENRAIMGLIQDIEARLMEAAEHLDQAADLLLAKGGKE